MASGLFLGLFSARPRIRVRQGKIVAATSWRIRLVTLGCVYREVTVDPRRQLVFLRRRFLWAFPRRRRLRFEAIEAVTYGYSAMVAAEFLQPVHQGMECFSVGLRLRRGDEVHLFQFFGETTFGNDYLYPDWLDAYEDQIGENANPDRESRAFVDVLSALIGVPVVPPRA